VICIHTLRVDERHKPCSICALGTSSPKIRRVSATTTATAVRLKIDDDEIEAPAVRRERKPPASRKGHVTGEVMIADFLACIDLGMRQATPGGGRMPLESPEEQP